MISLFKIFNFGANYNDTNSLWSDLFVTFFGALIGSVLGFISAYLIFKIQYNREKQDELEKTVSDMLEHFNLMIQLFKDSSDIAKKQIIYIKEYVTLISKDPFTVHESMSLT